MDTILDVEDVSFTYHSYTDTIAAPLFKRVSLQLEARRVTVLYGKPESGKSTFSKLLAALVPQYHGGELSGSIRIADTLITERRACDLLPVIGIVSQNPEQQLFMPVCEDEIIFPLENLGLSKPQIEERLERVIESYELENLRRSNPSELSGGEKKRLLMAVLDAVDPLLWVLDETFEELDTQWRERIISSLSTRGKSVLILASKDLPIYRQYGQQFAAVIEQRGGNRIETMEYQKASALLGDEPDVSLKITSDIDKQLLCKVDRLRFSYPHRGRSFDLEIGSFSLYSGEILALYGPNGSGKSTLCKLLCGLLSPDSGRILISKEGGLKEARTHELLTCTGYLFQNPDYQIFLPSVEEELSYGPNMGRRDRHEVARSVSEAIELFELGDGRIPPSLMSYGGRKRLQAAVYYLLDRSICILDETDSGLTRTAYVRLVELLANKVDALILITHDTWIAQSCAHRIVKMADGRILEGEVSCS